MRIVDPHVHFWDLREVAPPWLANPKEVYSGDNRKLPRRFTSTELRASTPGVEVLKVVHVETIPVDPLAETRWVQRLADEGGYPQGIVASADFSRPDAETLLGAHVQARNVRGIRQILNVHSDPRYDYVGRHYMQEPKWRANLRLLAKFKLSFDLQIYPSQAATAARLAVENPDITFILNHTGMCVDRNRRGWREWREGLRALATCANIAAKISGLAMFDHAWTVESLRPYVLETIEAFGIERCMFASNFPIDGLHSSYGALWRAYAEIVADTSEAEREALFVRNAERYYRI